MYRRRQYWWLHRLAARGAQGPEAPKPDQPYEVRFTRSAWKQMKRLHPKLARKANEFIDGLQQDPKPHNVKKLANRTHQWEYYLTFNDRVVYLVYPEDQTVVIVYVGSKEKLNYGGLPDVPLEDLTGRLVEARTIGINAMPFSKPTEDLSEFKRYLEETVIVAGEGDITLYDNAPGDPVNVAIVHDGSGHTPPAAIYVSQWDNEHSCLEAAFEILEEFYFEHYRDYYDELVQEYGQETVDGYGMFTETFDGRAWSGLNAKGVAEAIEADKFASKYIEIEWDTREAAVKTAALSSSKLDMLVGATRDIPLWDDRVLHHLNYQDAYHGEADTIHYMVEEIADLDDTATGDEIIQDLGLDTDLYQDGDDLYSYWEDIRQAMAVKRIPTWRTTGLVAGQYDLGFGENSHGEEAFGFIFHADEEDTQTIRGNWMEDEDEMYEAKVKTAGYDLDKPLNWWSRREIQDYLEDRGFAVYDDEPEEDLLEAVRLDMEEWREAKVNTAGYNAGEIVHEDPQIRVTKWAPREYSAEIYVADGWHAVDMYGDVVGKGGLAVGADRVAQTKQEAIAWAKLALDRYAHRANSKTAAGRHPGLRRMKKDMFGGFSLSDMVEFILPGTDAVAHGKIVDFNRGDGEAIAVISVKLVMDPSGEWVPYYDRDEWVDMPVSELSRATETLRERQRSMAGVKTAEIRINDLDDFTQAYLETALWATNDESDEYGGEPMDANDESDEYGGEPMDANYDLYDISQECLQAAIDDCRRFQEQNADLLDNADYQEARWSDDEMAGHDFFLTRNGHGVGFWDRDLGEVGDRLSDAAEAFGEVWFYVGDDGQIYC